MVGTHSTVELVHLCCSPESIRVRITQLLSLGYVTVQVDLGPTFGANTFIEGPLLVVLD